MNGIQLTELEQAELYRYVLALKRIYDTAVVGGQADFGAIPRIVATICEYEIAWTEDKKRELQGVIEELERILGIAATGRVISPSRIRVVSDAC